MALVGSRPRRNLRETSYSRDSNTLRASVLDAALELGIGTSRAVENLIFDTVDEEDDADNFTTPALTSASATTSDENSPSVPPWNATPLQFVPPKPAIVVPPLTLDVQYTRAPSEDSYSYAPSSLRSNQPRKLRKARKDDGDDSDGGYLSDSSKKKKKGKDRKNAGSSSHEADFVSDGGYLSDATKKSSDKKKKDKKGDKVTDGYVTDSSTKTHHKLSKKSRAHVDDADLSDGGYLSEASVKKKKPFFRLGSRSPSTSRKAAVSIDSLPPPVPALPPPMHPIADRFARSPVSFDQLDDGRLSSAAPSIRAAYSPVPPSLDGSVTPLPSVYRGGWSPPPRSDSMRTATRPSSVDLSTENFSSSSTSHENIQFAPVSPMQAREAVIPYDPPRGRSRDAESRTLSPGSSHEQLPAAPGALRQHGVRFTPSTRFSPSDGAFPIPPSPSEVSAAPEKRHLRPKISLPNTSTFNSNSSSTSASPLPSILRNAPPMSAPSDSRPFLSPVTRSRLTPSPGIPNAPFLRGVSPSLSDISIISSSEFIVPSPRPRFFDELPPPSPPPTGPLPDVPSYGFFSQQQIPHIKRGRESPFPARGILPAEEASRLIEGTLRARREALLARLADSEAESRAAEMSPGGNGDDGGNGNEPEVEVDDNDVPDLPWLTEDVPTPPASLPLEQQREDEQDWPDDESVRPDVAQFYLYAPSGNSNSGGVGGTEDSVARRRRTPDAPHDERSTYTDSYAASTAGRGDARADIESYYFGVPDAAGDDSADDGEATESRASFVDDERSHSMRARLVARVDALYGTEKLPPVPKLRPF
ncbi:hypothetical protein EDB85DRAFT_1894122 [Lactarius pseudohatsudake]|nr:hypothetical protein EDB85DRAFT_1894122 [Lactarius pseudohatsudake]